MKLEVPIVHGDYSLTGLLVGLPRGGEINSMDDRSAMGLPAYAVVIDAVPVQESISRLRSASLSELAEIVENKDMPFESRYASGLLLGLLGDPRIKALNPQMVRVPGGLYQTGLSMDRLDEVTREFRAYGVKREWIQKETPRHSERLPSFNIGKYPITNQEYAMFLQETQHPEIPSTWPLGFLPIGSGNLPVCSVSPQAAEAYAEWLSARTGRRFRLPSEAEWEVAASGGTDSEYPWGNDYSAGCANTLEAGILASTPVGMFPAGASPFGCLDMAGNVEEYVADEYSEYSGGDPVPDDLLINGARYRVARGGSFTRYRDLARCKRRHGYYARPIYVMGFRLAETIGNDA
jgi:toxoflavin biosynthesis protein ToxD